MATVKLGGNRLGSGNKMNVSLKEYGRSTHNLGRVIRTSMAPGCLVPFFVEPGLPGDTFDIDLTTLIRTLPTNGPIFGSFKLQLDVFRCPVRLYVKQLHNNSLEIGKEMSKVLLPQMEITARNLDLSKDGDVNAQQISQSSLMAYLGVRGLGYCTSGQDLLKVKKNGLPLLMYWDIYKNYYANKQEGVGVVIDHETHPNEVLLMSAEMRNLDGSIRYPISKDSATTLPSTNNDNPNWIYEFKGKGITEDNIQIHGQSVEWGKISGLPRNTALSKTTVDTNASNITTITITHALGGVTMPNPAIRINPDLIEWDSTDIVLTKFDLKNIDQIREDILEHEKTTPFTLNSSSVYPYQALLGQITDTGVVKGKQFFEMSGMALKTYQSDRFNNWLSTEWIDGANGISEITAVDVSGGKFTIDTLNLQKKVWNMLNRIAVSGGSYADWNSAVYGVNGMRLTEIPVYMGGLSSEIVFNEVVSTAETQTVNGEQPLGTLGGRGRDTDHKGGTIRVKCDEMCYLMGIVSITPRVDYSQGNKWFTRLETMDDFHKPALDGIGFQELITDEIAAFSTTLTGGGTNVDYKSAGFQTAYIEYQTSQNEAYGTFAEPNKEMFMTLNRRYSHYNTKTGERIKDLTTYIDPTKFNYAFANSSLSAQNFWVQIAIDMKARRVMSAKQMPNL